MLMCPSFVFRKSIFNLRISPIVSIFARPVKKGKWLKHHQKEAEESRQRLLS